MSEAPTFEEQMKVRRWECKMRGHGWDPVLKLGQETPDLFVCNHCGRTLRVVED